MPWIESHDDIWEHHKLDKLQQELMGGLPDCLDADEQRVLLVGHLHALWHFTLRNAWRDANLEPWGDVGIERAAKWRRAPGTFVRALREAGLLNGFIPHGWLERAGDLVKKRLDRESARREKLASVSASPARGTDGGRTAPERGATVTNPTVTDRTDRKAAAAQRDSTFNAFWTSYPRRDGKQAAERAWGKLSPDAELKAKILAAVKRASSSPEWRKDGGKFIPYPATYLNGRRWEDQGIVLPVTTARTDDWTAAHLATREAAQGAA
jgi:hypothetical protein